MTDLGIAIVGSGRIGSLQARLNLEMTIPNEQAVRTGETVRLPLSH